MLAEHRLNNDHGQRGCDDDVLVAKLTEDDDDGAVYDDVATWMMMS